MILKTLVISVLIIMSTISSFAQEDAKERIAALKERGKQAIIWESIKDMENAYSETLGCWDLTAYKVTVLANSEEMKVLYKLPSIVILPLNTRFYGNLAGDVLNDRFTMEVLANPSDFEGPIQYYPEFPAYAMLEQIDFVIEAINKAQGEGSFTEEQFEGNMEIREYANFYDVIIRSGASVSYFKVEKTTGRYYDERHRQVKLPPQIEDKFVEIKDQKE